jgi:hypothetical protein
MLISTEDGDPTAATLRLAGRTWPDADMVHPVEEVPPGTPQGVLRRAVLVAARFDLAALYLGLASAVLGADPSLGPDAHQLAGPA